MTPRVTRFSSSPDLVLRSAIPKEKQETKKTAGEYSSSQLLKDSFWKEVYGLQVTPRDPRASGFLTGSIPLLFLHGRHSW